MSHLLCAARRAVCANWAMSLRGCRWALDQAHHRPTHLLKIWKLSCKVWPLQVRRYCSRVRWLDVVLTRVLSRCRHRGHAGR